MDDFEKKINEEVVDENASAEVKEKKSFKTKICNVFEKSARFSLKSVKPSGVGRNALSAAQVKNSQRTVKRKIKKPKRKTNDKTKI